MICNQCSTRHKLLCLLFYLIQSGDDLKSSSSSYRYCYLCYYYSLQQLSKRRQSCHNLYKVCYVVAVVELHQHTVCSVPPNSTLNCIFLYLFSQVFSFLVIVFIFVPHMFVCVHLIFYFISHLTRRHVAVVAFY